MPASSAGASPGQRRATTSEPRHWRAQETPSKKTLGEAADDGSTRRSAAWCSTARTAPTSPSTLREYQSDFDNYIRPGLGHLRLTAVDRQDVKRIVAAMREDGWKPSTVRNTINALRALYRKFIDDGHVTVNPTTNVSLPKGTSRRERVAPPKRSTRCSKLCPRVVGRSTRPRSTAAFGAANSALFAGRTLTSQRGRFASAARGTIGTGEVEPKSAKGTRSVPIPDLLVTILSEHSLATNRTEGLVFGRSESEPFTPSHIRRSAVKAWFAHNAKLEANARPESEYLTPIGLHEARHTYVTFMFHAGTPLEEIGDYVGHASSYMTDHSGTYSRIAGNKRGSGSTST